MAMANAPTGIANITFNSVIIALAVFLLVVDVYIRVMTAIKTAREEKKRKEQPVNSLEEKVEQHEKKLQRDYERINQLENGNRVMMRAMMALLSHGVNGNSIDKLVASFEEIKEYLIER